MILVTSPPKLCKSSCFITQPLRPCSLAASLNESVTVSMISCNLGQYTEIETILPPNRGWEIKTRIWPLPGVILYFGGKRNLLFHFYSVQYLRRVSKVGITLESHTLQMYEALYVLLHPF